MDKTLTTAEVAARLGVSTPRVRQMVLAGQLPAEKFGRDLMIKESDLKLVGNRAPGRPKTTTDDTNKRATSPVSRGNGASTGKKRGEK